MYLVPAKGEMEYNERLLVHYSSDNIVVTLHMFFNLNS